MKMKQEKSPVAMEEGEWKMNHGTLLRLTLFILSKDKVYKDIEAAIWPKIKNI